jgi:VWFA-related protein
MKCPRKFIAMGLAVFLVAAVSAMPQSSQQPPPPDQGSGQSPASDTPDPRAVIRSSVSLVVVPVTVKDSSGALVTDLRRSDFRIFEDGVEQPISTFSVDPFPLSAAILIDNDLKKSSAEKVQKTLQAISGGFSANDEVSLWRFEEFPEPISEFIANNDTLITQLKRVDLNSTMIQGPGSAVMTEGPRVNTTPMPGAPQVPSMLATHSNHKHIDDAIYAAGDQLRTREKDRRKIVFVISDGQNAKNNTHSYNETLKLLLSNGISVYAIGLDSAMLNRGPTVLGGNVLAKYAHATGGDIYYAPTREELENLYARVSEQARNQYTLAFNGGRADRSKIYHTIEVRVKRPGLNLLARDGYYLNSTP